MDLVEKWLFMMMSLCNLINGLGSFTHFSNLVIQVVLIKFCQLKMLTYNNPVSALSCYQPCMSYFLALTTQPQSLVKAAQNIDEDAEFS